MYADAETNSEEENILENNYAEQNMQLVTRDEEEIWNIEEAMPLNCQLMEEESDGEMDATLWVHRNIIKMSKVFGVQFEGCEKEALALFKKIDNRRQAAKAAAEKEKGVSNKIKGIQELKGLMTDLKFQNKGTKNRGRGKTLET